MASPRALGVTLALVFIVALLPNGRVFIRPAWAQAVECDERPATIIGTEENDDIRGTANSDVIVAKGGKDKIAGFGGDDHICGGDDFDILDGGAGADTLHGNTGPDRLEGGDGHDRLFGGHHSDLLSGGDGADRIRNDFRDKPMIGGPGPDVMSGVSVSYHSAPRGVVVDLAAGTARGQGMDRLRVGVAVGSRFDDRLSGGTPGNEFLYGLSGDDHLKGFGLYDDLQGGRGDDRIEGMGGRDDLDGGGGDDVVLGGGRYDFIRAERYLSQNTPLGNDRYDGGPDTDVFIFGFTETPTNVNLQKERAYSEGRDVLINIENISGSSSTSNRLIGDDEDNMLLGGEEGDVKSGRGGDDIIASGQYMDDDRLFGGRGNDRLYVGGSFKEHSDPPEAIYDGGGGIDTLDFSRAINYYGWEIDLSQGFFVNLTETREGDRGSIVDVENVFGGPADDRIIGNELPNRLDGARQADRIYGGEADDVLIGNYGTDEGDGGPGTDTCIEVEDQTSCEKTKS